MCFQIALAFWMGCFFASKFTGIKSLNSLMSFGQMSLQGVIWYGLMMKLVSLLGKQLEFPLWQGLSKRATVCKAR